MEFTVKKCGGEFRLSGKFKDIIRQASLIQSIPEKCPFCQNEIRFDYRKPKGFEYFSLRCVNCGASKNFGIAKEDNSLFLRRDEGFIKYSPKSESEPEPEPESPF